MECFYFLSKTSRPSCDADLQFGTATLCLQKIRKKTYITLKSQDSVVRPGAKNVFNDIKIH